MNRVRRAKKLNPVVEKRPWSDFTRDATTPLNGTFPYYSDGVAGEKYGSGNYKATNGRLYKVTSGAGTPLAWYPAPGYRHRDTGALGSVGYDGYSWSSATSGIYGLDLYFYSQSLGTSNSDHRAHGFQLRCLSE